MLSTSEKAQDLTGASRLQCGSGGALSTRATVGRNAIALVVAQVVTNVLSFITVPILVRSLGATEYGRLYLAGVIASFAAILLESGQEGYVVLAVARANARAGEILATGATM